MTAQEHYAKSAEFLDRAQQALDEARPAAAAILAQLGLAHATLAIAVEAGVPASAASIAAKVSPPEAQQ